MIEKSHYLLVQETKPDPISPRGIGAVRIRTLSELFNQPRSSGIHKMSTLRRRPPPISHKIQSLNRIQIAVSAEPVFVLLVVWRSPAESFVECGAVIVLMDMDQFMQDQIVNPLRW